MRKLRRKQRPPAILPEPLALQMAPSATTATALSCVPAERGSWSPSPSAARARHAVHHWTVNCNRPAAPFRRAFGGSSWTTLGIYDFAIFMPSTPTGGAIARVVSARTATYPASLTGSYCVAKEGATSSTSITINKVHAGTSSSVATATFAASGSTNQTCTFTAASSFTCRPATYWNSHFRRRRTPRSATSPSPWGGTYQ